MNSDFGFTLLQIIFLGGGIAVFAAFAIFFIYAASSFSPFKEKDDQKQDNGTTH